MKAQTFNPYLPSYEYIPDGEPYVFNGRLYVYGSHDRFGNDRYCSDCYILWSADVNDLSNWTCHGTIFHRKQDPMHTVSDRMLHAPDVTVGLDGRYYLYYPNVYQLGVAVSDTPEGPFEFYGRVQYANGTPYGNADPENHILPISADDPAVLTDDDGRIWLYTGYVPGREQVRAELDASGRRYQGAFCVELETDMLTVKGEPKQIVPGRGFGDDTCFAGNEFFEASGIRKIGDTYYFVYSSHRSHDLCYATSLYPDRDFVYRGILVSCIDGGISNTPVAIFSNTHGNIVEISGQWYVFYHRSCGSRFVRQGCAEEIKLLEDGSFAQAEITSCGLNGKPLDAAGEYPAYIACNLWNENADIPNFTQDGADGEVCPQYIANITSGSYIGYKYFDFPSKPITLTITYRGTAEGSLHISTGSEEVLASVPVTPSEKWNTVSMPVAFPKGKHPLFFSFAGAGSMEVLSFAFQ